MTLPVNSAFVFSVVGTRHVLAASIALEYLKRVTRHPIIVVQARSERRAAHDTVIEVEPPTELDDHQASIWLKTNLLAHVRGHAERFCYLDSDVIAVDPASMKSSRIAPAPSPSRTITRPSTNSRAGPSIAAAASSAATTCARRCCAISMSM